MTTAPTLPVSASAHFAPGTRTAMARGDLWLLLDRPLGDAQTQRVWAAVNSGVGIEDLVDVLFELGLRAAPDFALAVLVGDRLRVLARGAFVVEGVDASGPLRVPGQPLCADVLLEGAVRVSLLSGGAPVGDPVAPLVLGMAPADGVFVSLPVAGETPDRPALQPQPQREPQPQPQVAVAVEADPVVEVQHQDQPVVEVPAEPEPEREAGPEAEAETGPVDDRPVEATHVDEVSVGFAPLPPPPPVDLAKSGPGPSHAPEPATGRAAEGQPDSEPVVEVQHQDQPVVEIQGESAPVVDERSADATPPLSPTPPPPGTEQAPERADAATEPVPVSPQPPPPPPPPAPAPAPVAPPPTPPAQLLSDLDIPFRMPPTPASSEPDPVRPEVPIPSTGTRTVAAARCLIGHWNRANAAACRVCALPVTPQEPREIPSPPLGRLLLPDAEPVALDATVVIGRAPSHGNPLPVGTHAIAVTDPRVALEDRHVAVSVDGWDVRVTDLGSASGTEVIAPDGQRLRLTPGTAITIPPSTRILLAGSLEVVFEATA